MTARPAHPGRVLPLLPQSALFAAMGSTTGILSRQADTVAWILLWGIPFAQAAKIFDYGKLDPLKRRRECIVVHTILGTYRKKD
jgi:hypothetical protein